MFLCCLITGLFPISMGASSWHVFSHFEVEPVMHGESLNFFLTTKTVALGLPWVHLYWMPSNGCISWDLKKMMMKILKYSQTKLKTSSNPLDSRWHLMCGSHSKALCCQRSIPDKNEKQHAGCDYFLCDVMSSTVTAVKQINGQSAGKSSQSSCGEKGVQAL